MAPVASRMARTAPLRSARLKLNVYVAESGTWMSYWAEDGSRAPFSAIFVILLENQVELLIACQDEEPTWLRQFNSDNSDLLGPVSYTHLTLPTNREV